MNKKEEMVKKLKELLRHGYDVYVPNENLYDWTMVTTPDGNLLYIECAFCGGYDISLRYTPSKKCGDCCSARNSNDDPYNDLTLETLKIAENRGLTFAHKLHAQLYPSADEALKGIWDFGNYYKLENEGK